MIKKDEEGKVNIWKIIKLRYIFLYKCLYVCLKVSPLKCPTRLCVCRSELNVYKTKLLSCFVIMTFRYFWRYLDNCQNIGGLS